MPWNAVVVRLRRQQRLVEEPLLSLHAIVDKAALRREGCIGDARREQLRRIVALGGCQM
jgi:hypothetical protein